MPRTRITTLAALLLAALLLAGCGGSGGGEPTVTQTLHDELQAELDAALADLEKERKAKADEEAARETAEGEVTRLRGELETATDNVTRLDGELATATTGVGRLTAQLATANNNVESLTDRIGTADDADSLQGMLAAEKARVTTLMNQIGTAPGGDDTGGSGLRKDLADAEANVARLTAQIGTAEDADSLQGMLKAEKDEVTRLTTLIGAEANEADADGSLYAQLKYAKAEVMRLTGEIGTASDPDSLAGMLEAEKQKVSRLENRALILNDTITGLRSQLADARTDVADAERETEQAEREADQRVAEAEQQVDVIVRAPNLLEKLAALNTSTEQTGVAVTHAPGERSATFQPTTAATRGSAVPSVPGTWNHRASFSSTVGVRATDTFYLYSNIERPAKRKFWQVYGVDEPVSGSEAMARLTGSRQLRVTDDNDTSDVLTDDSVRVAYSGSFDGAGGTFSCTGTGRDACVLTNAATVAEGLTIGDGTWTFAPSSLSNRVGSDMQDDTYLYFGIWAREPKEASNTTNLDFRWIADGDSGDITVTNFDDLEGTATFNGGAVGKYALKAVAGREARIGTFTAKATFTASFDEDTLSGTIDEFREGGSSLGADWRISLIEDASDTGADLTASGASGEAHGSIGGVDADGDWAATLHGSDNMILTPRGDATITYPRSLYPAANLAGVVGWFNAFDGANAAASNAAIAGAFGAACTSGAACGK